MKKEKIKAAVSLILLISVLASMISGTALFFIAGGMIGPVPRRYVLNIHEVFSFVMFGALLLHFPLNANLFRREWSAFCRKKNGEKEV